MENIKTAFTFSRSIGNTRYHVNVYCAPQGTDTFEEKLLQLIRHDILDKSTGCGIMNVPQMSRQSERSAHGSPED